MSGTATVGAGSTDALPGRLGAVLALDPDAPALEFEDRWRTWGELAATADAVADAMAEIRLPRGGTVGLLLRNRPASVGLLLGVLRARGCAVVVNPHLGAARVGDDLRALELPLLAGERTDLDAVVPADVADRSARFALDDLAASPTLTLGTSPARAAEARVGVAVRMLTSGTTGPPKRVDLRYETLERVMRGAKHYESDRSSELRLRDGVAIVNAPLVHVAGIFRVIQAVLDGRRIALLERFTVDAWIECVRRHRPKTVSLVPTALQMVLEADLAPDDLASVRSVVSGTAPLAPDLADAFTAKYGVPVLSSYGATEFGGGVAGWNLADYRTFAGTKRGSVGRAHPGCALRVVDATSAAGLPTGEVGVLEVRAEQLGDEWVRTTDLARLDDDGFLWIVGRADQTIVRGGFKVQPEVVRAALERHPEVREAAVVGVDDPRLGQVPVAAVERLPGSVVDEAGVLAHASEYLARYEVPVTVRLVDRLPRTASGKADLAAVRALFT